MTLREAQEEVLRLDNEERYWLNEKENIKSIVMPKALTYEAEHVQGGKKEDKMLIYVELLDERKIDDTLKYINLRRNNLMNYIEKELRITNQYGTMAERIYALRNDPEYLRTHNKKMPYWKIAKKINYSPAQVYRILRDYINKRNDEE